jgi:hypothetical protein
MDGSNFLKLDLGGGLKIIDGTRKIRGGKEVKSMLEEIDDKNM